MAITDLITVFVSIFFLARGSSRGFMHSLFGPFSIILASILSIVYYQATKEMLISLAIGVVGPLLLNILFKFFLKTWVTATNTDIKPDFLSRLGGAFLTLTWGWVFIIFTLILLSVLPPFNQTLANVHKDVTKSMSYCRIAEPMEGIFFAASKRNETAVTSTAVMLDSKSLAEDPRFQQVLQDPEIQKEIQAHDIVKLMSNPKMMKLTKAIMSDPATMKKVMALYGQAQQQRNFAPQNDAQSNAAN
jgi:uncharacterized membrane protein